MGFLSNYTCHYLILELSFNSSFEPIRVVFSTGLALADLLLIRKSWLFKTESKEAGSSWYWKCNKYIQLTDQRDVLRLTPSLLQLILIKVTYKQVVSDVYIFLIWQRRSLETEGVVKSLKYSSFVIDRWIYHWGPHFLFEQVYTALGV